MTEGHGSGFDGNDYRKRVLAAVEQRGGPDTSDPFELYDLPPDGDLPDGVVAARVAEVWGFWQRQRDHPKYRVLVALLVEGHAARSAELLDADRRRFAAARVRAQREQRDSARYALLDAAIARLVGRYGGLPRDKVAGLHEVGALAGLDRAEVATRLRRHRVVEGPAAAPAAPGVPPERRRQVRDLLVEFGRLVDEPAPPTLLALLGLEPSATDAQVAARTGAWRSRARELPPGRLRAVTDELLVHVAELVEPGRAAVEVYLDAVAVDVGEHLRPRVRAAVLVEDRLLAEDHDHLVDEAVGLGLDRPRALAVLTAVAAELGAPVEAAPSRPPAVSPPRRAGWEEPLAGARAALRAGRPVQARRLADEARRRAGHEGAAAVGAVLDEVTAVLADAERRWTRVGEAVAAARCTEAAEHLHHLERFASDLPAAADLTALLARVRAEITGADEAVAAALAGPDDRRAGALQAVLVRCADHPEALAALARIPLAAPAWVDAARDRRGSVVVRWAPSDTPGVAYKVSRQRPDGSWQVVGRVAATDLEDGGAPAGGAAPVYAVVALQAGRSSDERRSDVRPGPGPAPGTGPGTADPDPDGAAPDPPREVRAVRLPGGSVEVAWTAVTRAEVRRAGGAGVEFRVRCLGADGRWRVVGRTHAGALEDGGAPTSGPVPVYAVSAAAGGSRSAEVRSDGGRT